MDKTAVLDRYVDLIDAAVEDITAIEHLRCVFASDATIQIRDAPVTGIEAILDFYRSFVGQAAAAKHFWTVEEIDDETCEVQWVAAAQMKEGNLVNLRGVERATVRADGLITRLWNVRPQE